MWPSPLQDPTGSQWLTGLWTHVSWCAVLCSFRTLTFIWLLSLILTLKQGMGQDKQEEEGTASRPCSNLKHPCLRSAAPPSTQFSKLSFRQSSGGAPTPSAVPCASQLDVSETSLAQTCSSPKQGFFSPSAPICFMQENGRKLCSLIDVREDVVPAWEIYPSQAGLWWNSIRVGDSALEIQSLTVRILNQSPRL